MESSESFVPGTREFQELFTVLGFVVPLENSERCEVLVERFISEGKATGYRKISSWIKTTVGGVQVSHVDTVKYEVCFGGETHLREFFNVFHREKLVPSYRGLWTMWLGRDFSLDEE